MSASGRRVKRKGDKRLQSTLAECGEVKQRAKPCSIASTNERVTPALGRI